MPKSYDTKHSSLNLQQLGNIHPHDNGNNAIINQLTYELLDSENENGLLWQVLSASSDAILISSSKGEIVYVNSAWEKLTGYKVNEVKGNTTRFLHSPATPKHIYLQMYKALKENRAFTSEDIINKRKDGSEYKIHTSIFPIKKENKTSHFVEIHYDITQRKQQEESEHHIASLVKYSNDAIIGLSPDLLITSWNPAAEKVYGYKKEEILGQSIRKIIPVELYGEEKILIEQALVQNNVISYATKRLSKNGTIVEVALTISPMRNHDSILKGYSLIHHDISEYKKMENKLTESERRFRAIFNTMFQYTALLSIEGKILEINQAALDVAQKKRDELIGQYFSESPWWPVEKEKQLKLRKAIRQAVKGKFVRFELTYETPDFEMLTIDFSFKPITNVDGAVSMLIAEGRDISDRKKLEEQKSAFLSIASHELKTPITSIKLMLEMFFRKAKRLGIKNSELEIIDREFNRLSDLVKDLLDVSRIESKRMHINISQISLSELIQETLKEMKLIAGNRKIVFKSSGDYNIEADRNRIEQVLINLLSNAIKYSPDNTTITIAAERKKRSVIVSVEDQGLGIPRTKLSQIFKRFYQIDRRSIKGFGLGLYICKEIIKKHKGKIWVKSIVNQGSTFYFSLPFRKKNNN